MPIYRPSELLPFLQAHQLMIKKSLSQNFLIDGNIIHKIVDLAEVSPDDFVIEIGPGPGALTQALLNAKAQVLALELDDKLAQALHRLQTPDQRLTIISVNALDFSWEKELSARLRPGQKAKVISNLPYHITSPILGKLLHLSQLISQVTIMIQKEVALRILAQPGTKDISSLSIFVQYYSDPTYGFTVKPSCFIPQPKVQSSVIRLNLKTERLNEDAPAFFSFIHTAFQQRRKTLRASLKSKYGTQEIIKALQEIGLKEDARPEMLHLDQWLRLFQAISLNFSK